MRAITGNEAYRPAGNGNLKKRLVRCVRQRVGERRSTHDLAAVLNMLKEGNNPIDVEAKLGTT